MARRHASLLVAAAAAGCASQSGFIPGKSDPAMQRALSRGRFDLACPNATGSAPSSNDLPQAESGEWKAIERAELAIGAVGCDKRASYTVVRPDKSDTCMPAQPAGK